MQAKPLIYNNIHIGYKMIVLDKREKSQGQQIQCTLDHTELKIDELVY